MAGMNRAELAACSCWDQSGVQEPLLVMDLDEGTGWYCRPSGQGAKANQLCEIPGWPSLDMSEMEILKANAALRRYIMSGRHPLREGGCAEKLQAFEERFGPLIDQLCENSVRQCEMWPYSRVIAIGRTSAYYPAEYRVRCMFSFAPLAPDDMLRFLGVVRSEKDLLGRTVALEVLMREKDGSIAPRSLMLAGPETPLDILSGEPLPDAPLMLVAPGSEVRFTVDGQACRVKLADLGLPESGALVAVGLMHQEGQLVCCLAGRVMASPVKAPILPVEA